MPDLFRKLRVKEALASYARVNLLFLPVIVLLRVWEYILVPPFLEVQTHTLLLELAGVVHDSFLFFFLLLGLLIPFLLIARINRRLAVSVHLGILTGITLASIILIRYFITTLVPLDQVIFSYSFQEILMITRNSARLNFRDFLPFLLSGLIFAVCQYSCRKMKIRLHLLYLFYLLLLISPVYCFFILPKQAVFERDIDYYLQANKLGYFAARVVKYRSYPADQPGEAALNLAIRRFQMAQEEFDYIGTKYPLLHRDHPHDVLGSFFKVSGQKPNIVVIIMESLSSSFCGYDPRAGHFMPFLDSLITRSLFWENFLSTSERTFNVLPGFLGSLPYSSGAFLDKLNEVPYHLSLIGYLKENGYFSSFFYGGDPAFNDMDSYLSREGINYILTSFPASYHLHEIKHSGYHWGYYDGDLFKRSFEVIDSLNRNPRLDIYLTLSLHAPFIVPEAYGIEKRFDSIIDGEDLSTEKRNYYKQNRNLFQTILYTDQALREFFGSYRKRPDFANTIFLITGDHALPELGLTLRTPLERYHVPLIIFSPLLARTATIHSVSSHFDVAPSLMAFLAGQYGFEPYRETHWLGAGIDTLSSFRNIHTLAFVLNNKAIIDYLHREYFLGAGRVFRLQPGLDLSPVSDDRLRNQLEQELNAYILVTESAARNKTMIPEELYFGRRLNAEQIPLGDSMDLPAAPATNEYLAIIPHMALADNTRYLEFEITFLSKTEGKDIIAAPQLVVEVDDDHGRSHLWKGYPLKSNPDSLAAQQPWIRQQIRDRVGLIMTDTLETWYLKMYLWNRYRMPMQYDSLTRKLVGYH